MRRRIRAAFAAGDGVRPLVARLLRCIAFRLDPRTDLVLAQARYRDSIDRYARAERELLDVVRERAR